MAGTSQVSGTGNYSLNYGNNTINITCISQSGSTRTYTIAVARCQPQAAGSAITVAEGATVTLAYPVAGNYITGIQPGATAGDILAGVSAQNCTARVVNAAGGENNGVVGTGCRLEIYAQGALAQQYELVIYGDINGDGRVSNVDLVLMQKQILGITGQSGCYLEAANTSRDGGVSNKDLVILQKHILGISQITQ